MSYSTYPLPDKIALDFRLTWVRPAARVIGAGLTWLGGGVLFATTVYLMAALPGLLE